MYLLLSVIVVFGFAVLGAPSVLSDLLALTTHQRCSSYSEIEKCTSTSLSSYPEVVTMRQFRLTALAVLRCRR
jgi:hypothetical protein